MPDRDPMVRLLHMRDHARKAVEMAKDRDRSDLDNNDMLSLALARLVELVGEAANQVEAETRARYPEIPWPKIIGMRHRLIHEYDKMDQDILWDTIKHDLPVLIAELDKILD